MLVKITRWDLVRNADARARCLELFPDGCSLQELFVDAPDTHKLPAMEILLDLMGTRGAAFWTEHEPLFVQHLRRVAAEPGTPGMMLRIDGYYREYRQATAQLAATYLEGA